MQPAPQSSNYTQPKSQQQHVGSYSQSLQTVPPGYPYPPSSQISIQNRQPSLGSHYPQVSPSSQYPQVPPSSQYPKVPPSSQYQPTQPYSQTGFQQTQNVELAGMRQQVLQEHSLLLEWLLMLSFTGGQQAQVVQQITSCYNQAIHHFQQDTAQSLMTIVGPLQRDQLEIKWLQMRLNITRMTSQDLQMLVTRGVPPTWFTPAMHSGAVYGTPSCCTTLSPAPSSNPSASSRVSLQSSPNTNTPTPTSGATKPLSPVDGVQFSSSDNDSSSDSGSDSSTRNNRMLSHHAKKTLKAWLQTKVTKPLSPVDGVQSPISAISNEQFSSSDSDSNSDSGSDSSTRNSRLLSHHAKKTLKAWYQQNRTYPYPSSEMTRSLAREAGISVDQVRKWFSNQRLRGKNTYVQKGLVNPRAHHSQVKKQSSQQLSPGATESSKQLSYFNDLSKIQIAGICSLAPIPMKWGHQCLRTVSAYSKHY